MAAMTYLYPELRKIFPLFLAHYGVMVAAQHMGTVDKTVVVPSEIIHEINEIMELRE